MRLIEFLQYMQDLKKVIICAGGTGGHIFPALAVYDSCLENKKEDYKLLYISDDRFRNYKIDESKYNINILPIKPMRASAWGKLSFLLSLMLSCFVSFFALLRFKPDVVFCFGGYPTLPVLISCVLLRVFGCKVKVYLHEQNSILGRVNKLFLRFADRVYVNFPAVAELDLIKNSKAEIIMEEPLVRDKIKQAKVKREQYLNSKKASKSFDIVIIGGSQGAAAFDKIIPEAIVQLKEQLGNITSLKITQQVKKANIANISSLYEAAGVDAVISDFFSNIDELYSKADLLICRCGATTLAEVKYLQIPAILVPLPTAKDNHQYHNAESFVKMMREKSPQGQGNLKLGYVLLEEGESFTKPNLVELIKGQLD